MLAMKFFCAPTPESNILPTHETEPEIAMNRQFCERYGRRIYLGVSKFFIYSGHKLYEYIISQVSIPFNRLQS